MENPSDFLSRHHSSGNIAVYQDYHTVTTEYLQFPTEHAVPRATMQYLITLINNNRRKELDYTEPNMDPQISIQELQLFRRVKGELTICDSNDIVLRGFRIVLPSLLRHHAVKIAQEGNQGILKTKNLLRENVWFPGIDAMAKKLIDSCISCQTTSNPSSPEPLIMRELPPEPWHTLHIDFCRPFPDGK